jgi:hypothetical protein
MSRNEEPPNSERDHLETKIVSIKIEHTVQFAQARCKLFSEAKGAKEIGMKAVIDFTGRKFDFESLAKS